MHTLLQSKPTERAVFLSNHFETRASHGGGTEGYQGAVSFPIFQTSTYQAGGEFTYSRCQNPTRKELEHTVASLEEGAYGFAFSSGLAAVSSVFSLLKAGDHVLISDDLYGGTYRLIREIWSGFGIRFTFADLREPERAEGLIRRETRLIFAETPTNPMMKVLPLARLASLAGDRGILFAVDNTFLTPYFQKPLTLGADIVVHSGTKFLSGHHDTVCGFAVTSSEELAKKLGMIGRTLGNAAAPFDSWLALRGIQTLPLRMEKHASNAHAAAAYLESHPRVERVFYPGLPSHPSFELMKKQATGAGGVLSFLLKDDGVEKVLNGGKLIRFAESLGGTTSLITYPQTQTHASVPKDVRERIGITPRLLRLSLGLEHIEDLLEDLEQMLSRK